jgi:phosphatidylserine/phosphatidylglycerophosphate/cardiolipin synthase-like enzyme
MNIPHPATGSYPVRAGNAVRPWIDGVPAFRRSGKQHDVYVALSGPAAIDIHHNFVQRRNETSERGGDDGRWGHDTTGRLPFPTRLSAPRGPSRVQIQLNTSGGMSAETADPRRQ